MSIGTSLGRASASIAVWSLDKTIRLGEGVLSGTADFGTTFALQFEAKNSVASAKRTVDFAANKANREAMKAAIAAGTLAPVQTSPIRVKTAKA